MHTFSNSVILPTVSLFPLPILLSTSHVTALSSIASLVPPVRCLAHCKYVLLRVEARVRIPFINKCSWVARRVQIDRHARCICIISSAICLPRSWQSREIQHTNRYPFMSVKKMYMASGPTELTMNLIPWILHLQQADNGGRMLWRGTSRGWASLVHCRHCGRRRTS